MAFPHFLRFVIDLRFLLFGLALRAHIVLAVDIRVVRATHEISICRMLVTGSAMRTHRMEETEPNLNRLTCVIRQDFEPRSCQTTPPSLSCESICSTQRDYWEIDCSGTLRELPYGPPCS
jgi:hypothetical protein